MHTRQPDLEGARLVPEDDANQETVSRVLTRTYKCKRTHNILPYCLPMEVLPWVIECSMFLCAIRPLISPHHM